MKKPHYTGLLLGLFIVIVLAFDTIPVQVKADMSFESREAYHNQDQDDEQEVSEDLEEKRKEKREKRKEKLQKRIEREDSKDVEDTEKSTEQNNQGKFDRHTNGVSAEFLRAVSNINSKFVGDVQSEDVFSKGGKILDISTALRKVGALKRFVDTATSTQARVELEEEEEEEGGEREERDRHDNELNDTARIVRTLDEQAKKLKYKVRSAISKDLTRVYTDLSRRVLEDESEVRLPNPTPATKEEVQAFVHADREKKLKIIAEQLDRKEDQIATYVDVVVDSSVRGAASPRALDTVLRSSMAEVEALVEAETGVDVDLSAYSRRVVREVKKESDEFERQIDALNQRGGLDLYRDTDKDGVSDYDEVNIYFTNPNNAFTAGSSLTDGERILLGFDAHSTSTERVTVESPLIAGVVTDTIFEVSEIAIDSDKTIKFAGSAMPNSFVTIYVYSTPIVVTVKADGTGKWEYTLDAQLEDGEHSLYVATVNNAGKILAKSTRVPFTKTAEAVDFTPLLSNVTEPTPLSIIQENAIIAVVFVFAVFAMIIVLTLGSWRTRRNIAST